MHICPHCLSQTILWIAGVVGTLPLIGIYTKNWLARYRCKEAHKCDDHEHK
jgi:hypothetical protein